MNEPCLAEAEQVQLRRLDSSVIPLRYKLDLVIDPNIDIFSGYAEIEISLGVPSDHILLHSLGLIFDSIEIENMNTRQVAQVAELANDGTISLDFLTRVPAGKTKLHFRYHAAYSKSLEGLYKVTDDGKSSVFTQFQAIGARRAFPCFDEPGLKATYDVSITAPKKYKAISNTIETGTQQSNNQTIIHHFATTKPLPTYLVVFAVGDFDIVNHAPIAASKLRMQPIPLRGIAMRGRGAELKTALDMTEKLVLNEEKYFGVAYPFDKLDIIAVPDFGAGGMENAGAITYDENLVLLGDDATLQRRREFLTTHAHEIAHQWFGNLVTPKWWDDLWLNESFASLMESKFAHEIEPDWRFETDILKNAHEAMIADGASSVRRVHEPVTGIDGITAAFDAITYQKGAAILEMVEATVGELDFQKFVRKFLATHAFKTINSQDFTKALLEANNGQQAAAVLTSFIESPGLPVLKIDNDGSSRKIMQSRFLAAHHDLRTSWTIPIELDAVSALPFHNRTGYFIFDLSPDEWIRTLRAVPKMSVLKALAVAINFDLAFVEGRISISDYLSGVASLASHPDWEVAEFQIERLKFIEAEAAPASSIKFKVQQLIRKLYSPILIKIGITTSLENHGVENWNLELQREHLVDFFAASDADLKLKSELAEFGRKLIKNKVSAMDGKDLVPPDVIESTLIAAAVTGDDTFLQKLILRLAATDDGHEREIWLHAIAASHASSSSEAIEKLLLSSDIRNQEILTLLFARATVAIYRNATWGIVERNIKVLIARLNGDLEISLIQIADSFATEDLARRVENTITPFLGNLRGGAVQLNQTLERIRLNSAIVLRFQASSAAE